MITPFENYVCCHVTEAVLFPIALMRESLGGGVQVCGGEGSSVKVKSEGEWRNATVSKVRDDKIKVHYVGCTDEEDEWIALNSGRLRLPKNT